MKQITFGYNEGVVYAIHKFFDSKNLIGSYMNAAAMPYFEWTGVFSRSILSTTFPIKEQVQTAWPI